MRLRLWPNRTYLRVSSTSFSTRSAQPATRALGMPDVAPERVEQPDSDVPG
jgi:hypothetical protein